MKKLEQLLLRIQKGDVSALDDVYALTSKALFSLAFSLLREQRLAEDAVHNAYIIVLQSKSYREGGNAFSWLYTICKNCALKILEKEKKAPNALPDTLAANEDMSADNRILIEQLLKHLEEQEREIVLLYTFGDLKHKDIAAALGIPEGTVRYLYARAIHKLKEVAK